VRTRSFSAPRAFLETTDPPFCGLSNIRRSVAEKDAEAA
jgi:hypothetical protein